MDYDKVLIYRLIVHLNILFILHIYWLFHPLAMPSENFASKISINWALYWHKRASLFEILLAKFFLCHYLKKI